MSSLAVDIGNTSISLCLFKDDKLFASKKFHKVNLILKN